MNKGRWAMCPYYQADSNESISCEDTTRRWSTQAKKVRQYQTYCVTEFWKDCPYAQAMEELYESLPKDPKEAEIVLLNFRLTSTRKELRKLLTIIGMQKKEKTNDN